MREDKHFQRGLRASFALAESRPESAPSSKDMASDVAILLLGLLSVTVVAVKLLRRRRSRKSVAIVVLGDIGRSPRMLYHAGSFVERGYKTYIVAYRGALRKQQS